MWQTQLRLPSSGGSSSFTGKGSKQSFTIQPLLAALDFVDLYCIPTKSRQKSPRPLSDSSHESRFIPLIIPVSFLWVPLPGLSGWVQYWREEMEEEYSGTTIFHVFIFINFPASHWLELPLDWAKSLCMLITCNSLCCWRKETLLSGHC